jgi:hypothetical protein
MKTFNCTADGKPFHTPRYWYDPWGLMVEMIFLAAGAVFFLLLDLYDREKNIDAAGTEFKERLDLAYTTVPHYLKHIKGGK